MSYICVFCNGYRNRRDLRVLTKHMVHMEHMVSGQCMVGCTLKPYTGSIISLPIEVTLIPFQFFNYILIVKFPIYFNWFYDL